MTVQDDVADLVTRMKPHGICDSCITLKLGLTVTQHANHKTIELARSAGFRREKDLCHVCGQTKVVIWRA